MFIFQKDLGSDSLDAVEIVMALELEEEYFKLEIPDKDKEADKILVPALLRLNMSITHPMAG